MVNDRTNDGILGVAYGGIYQWVYSQLRNDLNWRSLGSYDVSEEDRKEACRRQNIAEEGTEYIVLYRTIIQGFHGSDSWSIPYQAFLRYLESSKN